MESLTITVPFARKFSTKRRNLGVDHCTELLNIDGGGGEDDFAKKYPARVKKVHTKNHQRKTFAHVH